MAGAAEGWETEADRADVDSWASRGMAEFKELAAAYRSDKTRWFNAHLQHENVRLYSPGFQILGVVSDGFHRRSDGSYGNGQHFVSMHGGFPIFMPESWMKNRARNFAASSINHRYSMTIRWRRI